MFTRAIANYLQHVSDNYPLFLLAITWVCWVVWRLWRFKILPYLRPDEPRELPYRVLFLGHTVSFFKDLEGTVAHGREYFGNTRETFTVTVAGRKIYIMTSATNISDAHRRPNDFDYRKVITDIMVKFGISATAIKALYEKPDPPFSESKLLELNSRLKSMAHLGEEFMRMQLIPGKRYDEFQAKFLECISKRTQWDSICSKSVLGLGKVENAAQFKDVSFVEFVRQTIVESTTIAFFGNVIKQVDPTIVDTFLYFDDRIWLFLYSIPRPWASGMASAALF